MLSTGVTLRRENVHSMSADASISRAPSADTSDVESLHMDGLIQRTGDVAQNRLRIELEKEKEHPLRLELERVNPPGPSRVSVCSQVGNTTRHLDCDLTTEEKLNEAYANLRALILPFLPPDADAENINFIPAKMRVLYKLSDRDERVADLQEIIENDENCRRAFAELEDVAAKIWGKPLRSQPVEAGKKSPSVGMDPMVRTTLALQQLPDKEKFSGNALLASQLLGNDPAKQEKALKRITAIEIILSSLLKKIDEELGRTNTALQANLNDATLLNKLGKLHALKKQFEIDRTGLYVALAFAPEFAQQAWTLDQWSNIVDRAAKEAQAALQGHIEKERQKLNQLERRNWPTWVPSLIRGKEMPVGEDRCYSVDAAALIFSSMPAALARNALDFWKEAYVLQKRHCLEDELIAFAFGQGNIPQLDQIIAGIPDVTFQNVLQRELNHQRSAAQSILQGTTQFPTQPYPNTNIEDRVKHLVTHDGVVYGFQ